MSQSTVPCPHCGAEIRSNAKFCRHCGSSDADGWRDEYDELDEFAEEEFDYDEYVQEEFSETLANTETPTLWRFVAVVLLIVFTFGTFWYLLFLP